jgi:hypothetical protein
VRPPPSKCWRGGCAAIPSIGGGVVVWSPLLQLDGAGLDNHSTITSHNKGGDCMITLDAIDGYGHPPYNREDGHMAIPYLPPLLISSTILLCSLTCMYVCMYVY